MAEEGIKQTFRLKYIKEKRNCFIEKINQNKLICNTHKKVCAILSYIEHFLILASVLLDVFKFLVLLFCLVLQ